MAAATLRHGGSLHEARASAQLAPARGLRCQGLMYNTIANHVHVGDPPDSADPRAMAWLDDATHLATAFTKEVNGNDAEAPAELVIVLVLAGSVWQTTLGKPRWDDLDVGYALDLASQIPAFAIDNSRFVTGFMAFVCYLNKHQLITKQSAHRIHDALLPVYEPILLRYLQSLTDKHSSWRLSPHVTPAPPN